MRLCSCNYGFRKGRGYRRCLPRLTRRKLDDSYSYRAFFLQKIKSAEELFNELFDKINTQIALRTKAKKGSGGDPYDLILSELCTLLNYNPDQLFLQDYNFVMKVLVSKAQNNLSKVENE